MDPVLFKIGIFEIRYYGLVYVFGFLLIYFILFKKRDKLNLSKKKLEDFMFYLILSVVIFSRLFHVVFSDFFYYFNNPLKIFFFWEGGMAFFGGLFGSVLTGYYFFRDKFYEVADLVVIPVSFVLFLGRIANFINQELLGKVSSVNWCVVVDGICRHPYTLYEAFGRFLVFVILIFLSLKKFKKGMVFWMFVCLISLSRFVNEFFRDNYKVLFDLSGWQILSFVLVLVSLFMFKDNFK